ncbi:MAG: Tol biopolymer transport system component [Myxococcota bacterium]|jgi:Tol biopolymer transport system component
MSALAVLWLGLTTARAEDDPGFEVPLDLSEGTWMSVSVHRDTVVFDLLGDLWQVSMDGGTATPLTDGPAWDGQPQLSPDGDTIAFVSDAGGSEQIWLMDADGGEPRPLTNEDGAQVTSPVWEPSGRHIIARHRTSDGTTTLWQYRIKDGEGLALTDADTHPHAGEPWTDGEHLWFSSRSEPFADDGDPVAGLWQVWRLDRNDRSIHPVLSGAGSAARPALSPDGDLMAFISRDRDQTVLELLEVGTGRRRVLADGLSLDAMEGVALRGVYPAIDWTDDGRAVVLWSSGKLWRVGLDGSRAEIPFTASGRWQVKPVSRPTVTIPDEIQAKVIRWPVWGPEERLAFSALGAVWVREPDGSVTRVSSGTGYAPAWRPDGAAMAWTSWSDIEVRPGDFPEGGGSLMVGTFGWRSRAESVGVSGVLVNPVWSDNGRQLAVLRGRGNTGSPYLGEDPWYEVLLLTRRLGRWEGEVVDTIAGLGDHRAPQIALHGGRIWFRQDTDGVPSLISVRTDGTDRRAHLIFPEGVTDIVPSPDLSRIAWRRSNTVHITDRPDRGEAVDVTTLPDVTLAGVSGDWLRWSVDGTALSWAVGPTVHTAALPEPGESESGEPVLQEPVEIALTLPRHRPEGTTALTHARLITMNGDEVIEDATVTIVRDQIAAIEVGGAPPDGATVIDCTGMTITPGLIDTHTRSHTGAGDILPAQEWRYLTALDFGVTTIHDPTMPVDVGLTQSSRVAVGFQRGPRVFAAASVASVNTVDRIEALGVESLSVPAGATRALRQQVAAACREAEVLCVAEGDDLGQMLSMVTDGYHAIAHSFPHTPIYADVRGLLAASGTAYSPTLLVNRGGLGGENFYYQYENPADDPRLLQHHPRRLLDQKAWRRSVLARDWSFQGTAADAAALARQGALVTLGSDGTLQGLGTHWELWAMAGTGAMSPMEALQAATIDGARTLGLEAQLGSIEVGKLADLLVLRANPLDRIDNTVQIALVIKNGEVVSDAELLATP